MVFCVSKFQKNGRICDFHWTFKSKKCFSFRGLRPLTPRPGALPLDPAEGSANKLALHALAMPPFCQILNTPLSTAVFVLLLYFYTVMVIEKKRNVAQRPRKYAILALKSKKKRRGHSPLPRLLPLWGGGHPLPTLHPLGAFGASTRLAPWALDLDPPTSTPGSTYGALSRALCHKVRYSARGCSSCILRISKRRLIKHGVNYHAFADDTQLNERCRWETWILCHRYQSLDVGTASQTKYREDRSTTWVNSMVVARQSSLALTLLSPVDTFAF